MTSAGPVARAVALVTACALPGFITGSVVLQLREDFALSDAALGVAFSVYWGVAAVAATPAGRLVERIGATAAMRLAGGIAAGSSALIALVVDSAAPLIALLAVGGLSIACATPGVNTLLLRSVSPGRQGLAFGLAQSSLPGGLLLAGVAVPAVSEPLGWRAVFGAAALLGLGAALAAPAVRAPSAGSPAAGTRGQRPNLRGLALVAAGISLGTGAVGACNAFLVAAAPRADISGTDAALTLAVGSALSIVARIVAGFGVDRRPRAALLAVAGMLAAGATGFALLATETPVLFLLGALLALTLGWGWMGLFSFAVVNGHPEAPEAATGVMQTGFFMGGVLGPVAFGLVAESVSFPAAWLMAAVGALTAAAVVFAGRHRVAPALAGR